MKNLPDYLTEDLIAELNRRGVSCTSESTGSILPSAQTKKVTRLIENGCALGSVLLHKTEGKRGITAIVSPHGHVEWAK